MMEGLGGKSAFGKGSRPPFKVVLGVNQRKLCHTIQWYAVKGVTLSLQGGLRSSNSIPKSSHAVPDVYEYAIVVMIFTEATLQCCCTS